MPAHSVLSMDNID